MKKPQTVLLTGATGTVGSSVLAELLDNSNYNVTTVLRSCSRSEPFLRNKYASKVSSGRLSFVEIPDMAVAGCFDDAASKSDFIIHVATPLAFDPTRMMEHMVEPSRDMVQNVLSASEKSGRVKRVVVTGSMVSAWRVDKLFSGGTMSSDTWNDITSEEAGQSPSTAYQFSKVHAERGAWEFMRSKPRNFDLIFLLAPSVTGRALQEGYKPSKSKLGGQAGIYSELFDVEKPGFLYPYFMDVQDVAKVHVKALSSDVPGNERYTFHHTKEFMSSNAAAKIIREDFPQLQNRVVKPDDDAAGTGPEGLHPDLVKSDASKAEKVFGNQWKSARQSIKETVEDIITFEER
ncbi:uncharacterized protein PV06_04031 [Exophiala oligosperma]|uniref:NAD-dependent epimerase/dehydratase domain-containing protein n=1 Tax=Exophiala oligosperma TaxID=215243 RepID=A0A0D2ECF9_9EURO|nr:uncharacterized protein PV06_04031 [Exophiala oligosperma]KIW45659.1 hypothetical protein PV06_04031 [Exophiala oligosperma]